MSFETTPFKTLFKVPQKNGLNKPSRVRGAGLPMVNMGEIFAYRRIADIEMDLVPTTEKEMGALLEYGDLLFARQSLVYEGSGKCAIFVGHQKTVFESHLIRVRLDSNVSDPRYFFYLFNSSVGRELMAGIISQGAGASGIKGSDLIELEVPRPPLLIQRQIADFLDSLEIQIEVLKQQNTVLESIAQALFKSWFVNFDPVHAKAAGREPEGLSAEIAALFPSEFEDSELGLIPKGWSVAKLSSVVKIHSGGTPKTSVEEYWNGDIPWFSVVDAPADGQVFVLETSKQITDLGLAKSPANLLPIRSTVVSARGTVGKLAMTDGAMTINQSCFALSPLRQDGEYWTFLQTQRAVDLLKRLAHGGVFDTITRATFDSVMVVNPANTVFDKFNELLKPLFDLIALNARTVNCLSGLRDELLPRLISGKIRIEEAEEALADVMPSTEKQVA